MLLGRARQMNTGKTSWNCCSACLEFFDLVKPGEDHCIVMTVYVMDGLMHAPCKRMLRVRHAMEEHVDPAAEHEGEQDLIAALCDWDMHLRCKSHAAQLSVAWALKPYAEDGVSKDAHNAIRSLRSKSGDLMSHLEGMMVQCVSFVDRPAAKPEVACFWELMGVRREMLGLFCLVDPQFCDGRLLVGRALATNPDHCKSLTICSM